MDKEQTPFTAACADRGWDRTSDFLKAFNSTAALIGEDVELTDRQLRRWRAPDPPRPRPRAWRVLHAMFGCSPLALGFRGPEPSATVGEALSTRHVDEEVGVNRRAFVSKTLGTAGGLALGSSDAVGTAHVLELREGLQSLYALDDAYGSGDVRPLTVRHLHRVRRIINRGTYPDTIGRQLRLLDGETAEQCAWLYFDAGDQEMARRYWGEALTTATTIRDTGLEILVLASLSLQASYEHRPRDAYDLIRAAHERAVSFGSPILLSVITLREARALILMGDKSAATKRLSDSMRLAERTGGRPAPEWAAFHGHAELQYAQGQQYAEVGHHKSAIPYLRAALANQDRAYGRNHALYRMTLARSLILAGEVDEGAAEVVNNLHVLEEVNSGRVTDRLIEVRKLLRDVDAVSAREAAEQLTEFSHNKREGT